MHMKSRNRKRGRPKSIRPKTRVLVVRCSEETWRSFRKYAADYESYEDALRSLLALAGALHEGYVF